MSLPRRRRERRLAGDTRTFFVRVPPVSEIRGVRTLKACEGSSHPSGVRVAFFSVTRGCARYRSLTPRLISCHASGVCLTRVERR
jgi:hypothetical protein